MFVAYFTLPMNRDRISVASQGDVFNGLIFINQFDDFITTISSTLHYNLLYWQNIPRYFYISYWQFLFLRDEYQRNVDTPIAYFCILLQTTKSHKNTIIS